ncbi:retrotransposon protein, putative, ty1-copia subclass, partial [Tanacetum coccineum]
WLLLPKTQKIRLSGQFSQGRNSLVRISQTSIAILGLFPGLQRTLEKYNAFDMMKELKTMFEEQAKLELFETVKAFHACKQEDGQSVSSYLLNMKSYLDTLERLGYTMPNELGTIVELHAIMKLHEKGIPKKAETPIVLAIREDMHNLYPNVSSMFNVSNKRAKCTLDSSYLWHCRLGHINKKRMDKLQHDGILQPTHYELLDKYKSCIFGKMANDFSRYGYVYLMKHKHEVFETFKVFQNEVENQLGYPKKTMGYYFYYPLENKIFVARNAEFFENNLIVQEASGSHGLLKSSGSDEGLELIQEEDTQPSKNTSKEHNEVAPTEVKPQNVGVPIRRSARIPQSPDRHGFYVDVEEHELGDLNEPPNYKAALSDLEFEKWLEAMNTEIQSNKVCKLQCSICGLKQASRSWNKRFDVEIKKIAFTKNPDDPCVYLKASRSSVAFLVLYVNDILLMGNSVTMLQEVKSWLCSIMYAQNPEEIHWTAVKTILKYLRNTKDMVLVYGAKLEAELKVSCYVDASFQTDKDDTKSQTWYVFVLNGGTMKKFIDRLGGVMPSNKRPMEMLCDDEAAIEIADDPVILKRGRHFQRKYHYIREVIQERKIVLKKVPTDDNVANPLTKPMSINRHYEHARAIGIVPASSLV